MAPATASERPTRLLRSSTFRLTVAYLLIFSLSALALLVFVYVAGARYMERQTMETIEAEIQGLKEQASQGGLVGLIKIIEHRSQGDPDRLGIYLLTDWTGHVLAGNLPEWPDVPIGPNNILRFEVEARKAGGGGVVARPVVAEAFSLPGKFQLLVGRDISDKIRTQQLLLNAILLGGAVMVVLGLVGGFVMSRWTLARLERVNRTTAAIVAGHLDQRIEVEGGGDEFDELAVNLNRMLEQIQRLLAGMREVTDNIAHDLRTPLNRLRSRIEVALMTPLREEDIRELLESTVHDADGLIETFNALLNIARAEAGTQRSEWEPLDLSELARDVFELYEPLAEEKSIALTLEANADVPVIGNRQLIAQALANITDNAIKYTPVGGRVRVSTGTAPGPHLEVVDDGPGIPLDMRAKALERFVRLDADRSTPGNGLGLSLVSAVARLHDAELDLGDNAPGLKVRLTFKRPLLLSS